MSTKMLSSTSYYSYTSYTIIKLNIKFSKENV